MATRTTNSNQKTIDKLKALRGSLRKTGPGARGLERMARNPKCDRLRAITLASVSAEQVAKSVYENGANLEEQSPFAMAQGNTFEKHLLRSGVQPLVELLQKQGKLGEKPHVADLSQLYPGSKKSQLEKRRDETIKFLRLRSVNNPWAPDLVIKPRIRIELWGEAFDIEPDFLVAGEGEFYRVGEIKSYPDRGGKTEPAKVRGACRQTAVGVVALRLMLDKLGFDEAQQNSMVEARGELVLRIPGTSAGTLRAMSLEGEVDSLERALENIPRVLDEILAKLPDDARLDSRETVETIPNRYRAACKEHCALANVCRRNAICDQSPSLLGDRAAEQLAPVVSIGRALELLHGETPQTDEEQRLADRLKRANKLYEGCFIGPRPSEEKTVQNTENISAVEHEETGYGG